MLQPKSIEYDGLMWNRDKRNGYYHNTKLRRYLHQYVWEKANGKIPEGYFIHHKDHNKENNILSNLQIIERGLHTKLHWHNNEELKYKARKNILKAKKGLEEWRNSEYGKKRQIEIGIKNGIILKKLHRIKKVKVCELCGKEYEVQMSLEKTSRFCSNNCKSEFRRRSGDDDEIRICEICGKGFKVNKYARSKCCSRECAGKKSSESRKGKPQRRCLQLVS